LAFYVYLMASRKNGTLYVGMTDDLIRRVWEHREGVIAGFTKRYGVKMLVWFEEHGTRESALERERSIEKWERQWKIDLFQSSNPEWRDLFPELGLG
jgi:putative endonuclease